MKRQFDTWVKKIQKEALHCEYESANLPFGLVRCNWFGAISNFQHLLRHMNLTTEFCEGIA